MRGADQKTICAVKWYNHITKILDNEERKEREEIKNGRVAEMTLEAQEARRIYKREYRRKNREKINRQQREWRAANLERVNIYQMRYWEKKAKGNIGICSDGNGVEDSTQKQM